MAFKFFSQDQSAFGLDISGGSFKFARLKPERGSTRVLGYSEVEVPKGMIVNDSIIDKKTFDYLIKQMLDKPQFGSAGTNYCVASLPESKSFVRVIQIPKMGEAEAASAVPFEAESFIPLPIDQVYMDWQIIGPASDPSRLGQSEADPSRLERAEADPSRLAHSEVEKMNVLMVATPKDYVDAYVELLEKSGLRPVALEVESQSCHRALVDPLLGETTMIVDIDAYRTIMIMVEGGQLQFTSIIPIAGSTFTECIARSLGISSQKAETIKQAVGIANTAEYPNLKTALVPVLANLSAEIKNILKFHAGHSEKQVKKIIFAGGSAKIKHLLEYMGPEFEEMSGLSLELAKPWGRIINLKDPPLDDYSALGYTTAIGLAMRGKEE